MTGLAAQSYPNFFESMRHIPVTILTGFLGSGKTTLLNRLLSGDHGLKIGIILNEIGEISIDGELVNVPEAGLWQLSNGCLCCTVRDDFEQGALQLLAHVDQLDYVVIETTGIADPRQIAEIFVQRPFQERTRLDSLITLLDAAEFEANLHRADSAYHQITCADLLILNKTDLISPSEQESILHTLRRYNSHAPCLTTTYAQVPLAQILDIHAFRPETFTGSLSGDPELPADVPSHTSIESESFILRQTLDFAAFREYLEDLPSGIFRAKGVIWIVDDNAPTQNAPTQEDAPLQKVIFHKVGSRISFFADERPHLGAMITKVVLIGRDLHRFSLETRLRACVSHPSGISAADMLR